MADATTPRSTTVVSAARLRRLAHDREAKRAARSAYIAESTQLQTTVKALTHQLYRIRGTLVPWKEVAAELRHMSDVAVLTNRQLQHQVLYYRQLAVRLDTWIQRMQPPTIAAGLAFDAWRDVYLASDKETRAMGLSWITKQLFHASEAHTAPSLFPHAIEDSVKVEWGRRGRQFIFQKVIAGSMQDAAKTLWSLNRAEGNHIVPGKQIPDGLVHVLHATEENSQRVSYAREEFMEAFGPSVEHVLHLRVIKKDRILIMARTIAQDAAFAPRVVRQSCREWYGFNGRKTTLLSMRRNEIRDIGNGQSLVRSVVFAEPAAAYETMTEYVLDLFPLEYERALAMRKDDMVVGSLEWENYLHRFMLTLGVACSRHYFAFFDKILGDVQDRPHLYSF
ncbi:hypothetical protein SPRG_14178 [Saprolegnia parasitica CBS 223.65]|uniref:Uncharacterized protein n=1 Tax=Saprolegnia parasitica (strain CBS 223.65) TaxID=695850 RepID=A0A067BT69_SAPPC|nr:hypothetical protein SPRG_14178 [Saprolegnia parasitica CBS 223.65]KDO20030.1 hypothetical protein SPRG_14178 [Saprolegnia parasitica CBS 223.65]|eukprot:XP_012209264.1 hypothetical protein SPRG_14178 [Saprolegnia parasitica CBS 223.65]